LRTGVDYLGDLGPHLAEHFQKATSPSIADYSEPSVLDLPQLLIIEDHSEIDPDPDLQMQSISDTGIQFHQSELVIDNRRVRIVLLHSKLADSQRDLRSFRINTVRIHSELSALIRTLRLVDDGILKVESLEQQQLDKLERFLNHRTRLLHREALYGLPTNQLLKASYGAAYEVSSLSQATVAAQLESVRDDVRASLAKNVSSAMDERRISPPFTINIERQTITMNDQSISVGDSSSVNGNLTSGNQVNSSFAQDHATPGHTDLTNALMNLRTAAANLSPSLSPEARDELEKRVAQLKDEATSTHSDLRVVETIANRIRTIASAVADAAGPVHSAVTAVVSLL
jgi:hypothetical protein